MTKLQQLETLTGRPAYYLIALLMNLQQMLDTSLCNEHPSRILEITDLGFRLLAYAADDWS